MRPIFACFFFFSCVAVAKESASLESEIKRYDEVFNKIGEKRVGIDTATLNSVQNPFISTPISGDGSMDGNATLLEPIYILEATLAHKAKINGQWYKQSQTIGSYKISKIARNSVIIENESEKKELFIRTKDDTNIKIFSK